jgi:hypothetical protein
MGVLSVMQHSHGLLCAKVAGQLQIISSALALTVDHTMARELLPALRQAAIDIDDVWGEHIHTLPFDAVISSTDLFPAVSTMLAWRHMLIANYSVELERQRELIKLFGLRVDSLDSNLSTTQPEGRGSSSIVKQVMDRNAIEECVQLLQLKAQDMR